MKNLIASSEVKVYGIAAANEILKLRKNDIEKTDKQLLQSFVDNIFEFVAKVDQN